MNRPLKLITNTCTLLLIISVGAFLGGYFQPFDFYFVSLTDSCNVTVLRRGLDSRLVIFNDAHNGPYGGSIVGLAGSPTLLKSRGFGDSWGIYYRDFRWTNATLWTLTITLWYPIIIFAIIPVARFVYRLVRRHAAGAA